jgi:cyclase
LKARSPQSLYFLVFAVLSSASIAQLDYSKVQIKTEKLSDTTYMLTGAGGNLGVSVGKDAVFVVDDEFAPLTPSKPTEVCACW